MEYLGEVLVEMVYDLNLQNGQEVVFESRSLVARVT